jgi:hypothetical protein
LSSEHNAGVGTGTVSAFQDSAAGILSPIGISLFADQQTARAGWRSSMTASSCSL